MDDTILPQHYANNLHILETAGTGLANENINDVPGIDLTINFSNNNIDDPDNLQFFDSPYRFHEQGSFDTCF